jgi:hypothetical protein
MALVWDQEKCLKDTLVGTWDLHFGGSTLQKLAGMNSFKRNVLLISRHPDFDPFFVWCFPPFPTFFAIKTLLASA